MIYCNFALRYLTAQTPKDSTSSGTWSILARMVATSRAAWIHMLPIIPSPSIEHRRSNRCFPPALLSALVGRRRSTSPTIVGMEVDNSSGVLGLCRNTSIPFSDCHGGMISSAGGGYRAGDTRRRSTRQPPFAVRGRVAQL